MPPDQPVSQRLPGRSKGSKELWVMSLLLLFGGLLRFAYLLEISSDPDFDSPHFESQYHDYWARALISGDWAPQAGITDPEIPTTPFFRPPGYPYFLAAAYQIFGASYWTPRLLQILLGLGSGLLIWKLTRHIFGAPSAHAALALAATYWVFLFFEGELMAPALLIFLLLASLLAASRWTEGFTPLNASATGILVGLAALVRPNALILPLVFLLWAWWLHRRAKPPGERGLVLPALFFLLATALTVGPATLRNWLVAEDPVLITSNAGINLFIGSHPQSDGLNPGIPAMADLTRTEGWESFDYPLVVAGVERQEGRPMRHSEVSSYFTRRALEVMGSDPSYLPRLTLRKLALLWGPQEVSNNKVIEMERETSRVLRLSPSFADIFALAIFGGSWLLLLPAAGLSEGRAGIADKALELSALLAFLLLIYTASYLPFFAAARFRLPMVPILMVFAGASLAYLGRLLQARRFRALALALIALALLRAGTGIAWVPVEPDRTLWHFRRALSHREKGQNEEAIREARSALVHSPGHGNANLLLGDLLSAKGDLPEASEAYRLVLSSNPHSFAARNNLATAQMRLGNPKAAIRQWQEALARDPDRLTTLNNLALALANLDEPTAENLDLAVGLAERANRLTRFSNPSLRRTLAIAYTAAGRSADARRVAEGAPAP